MTEARYDVLPLLAVLATVAVLSALFAFFPAQFDVAAEPLRYVWDQVVATCTWLLGGAA